MEKINKMTADTMISDAISKKEKLDDTIANTIAQFCVSRASEDKTQSIKTEVGSMLNRLPIESRVSTLLSALQIMTNQFANAQGTRKDSYDDFKMKKSTGKSGRSIFSDEW